MTTPRIQFAEIHSELRKPEMWASRAMKHREMLAGLPEKPLEPAMLFVSAYTVSRYHEEQQLNVLCKQPTAFVERLHVLGRTWNLPARPYALRVCAK